MKQRADKAIVLVGSLLAACHSGGERKSSDPHAVSACMAAQHSHDDYLLVTKCEPLGPQESFAGTWFVGFELSVFRKGYAAVPAEPPTSTGNAYELVVPTKLSTSMYAKYPEGPSAYQVTFLGRESALPFMPGVKLVVADRVLSLRPVPIRSDASKPQS